MSRTAAIIIIGDEILSGKVRDENAHWLACELRALGTDVRRIAVVPDDEEAIAAETAACSAAHDFVFTSGGVGPTHDDVTMEGVARAFGVGVVADETLAEVIRRRCGVEDGSAAMKMARVPEGAEVVMGTDLRFPPVVMRNVYIFPGIPEYLRTKFSALAERFRSEPFILMRLFVDEEECQIVEDLDRVNAACPTVAIGSYPRLGEADHRVIITLESTDARAVAEARRMLEEALPPRSIVRVEE